jgi:hypothetical protein
VFLKFVERFEESKWLEEQPSGAKQAAEKLWILGAVSESVPQGLKPQPDNPTLMARLKPCPCYNAPPIEFFRSL